MKDSLIITAHGDLRRLPT